jgi:hypothetical protein
MWSNPLIPHIVNPGSLKIVIPQKKASCVLEMSVEKVVRGNPVHL